MKSSFSDLKCRLCQSEDEDQNHIVNCSKVKDSGEDIDISNLREDEDDWRLDDTQLEEVGKRVTKFKELISENG